MSYKLDTLGKVCDREGGIVQTGPFGSQLHQRDYVAEGIPAIMPKDIVDGRINRQSVARITEQKADELARHKLRIGAVVLPRRGEINKRALITEQETGWLCGTGCIKVELEGIELLPQFLYYYLDLPAAVRWLEQHAVGTTMLNLSASIVRSLPVILPPLGVQERIASVLSAYDDLIENNRRRIQLMEQAARLIYQEWFVRLRFPGHEHVRVVDGVPEGWERLNTGQLSGYLNRGISPHYNDDADGLVINQKCIRGRLLDLTKARRQDRPFSPEKQIRVGDVLINSTGEGTLGRIAQVKADILNCTVDSHVTIVRPSPEIGWRYFGMALIDLEPHFSVLGRGATNQTELSRATIADAPLLVPTKPLVDSFEAIVSPISEQVLNLTEQINRLRQTRNLLLPKLMSGEIEV